MDIYFIIIVILLLSAVAIYSLENGRTAPWIIKPTPIPTGTKISSKEKQHLRYSVDPGAHIACRQACQEQKTKPELMNVCISSCIQRKWISENNI